jgi:hypothetical protein
MEEEPMTLTTIWHTLAIVAVASVMLVALSASYWPDRHPVPGIIVYFGVLTCAALAIAAWA